MIVFVSNDFKPVEIRTLEELKNHNHSDLNQNSYTMYLGDQRDLLYFQGVPEVHGEGSIFKNGSKINLFYNKLLKFITSKTMKVVIDNLQFYLNAKFNKFKAVETWSYPLSMQLKQFWTLIKLSK